MPKRAALVTIISVSPMMALSGVRSSWLMLARINVALCENLSFDFVRDITPVGRVQSVPLVMEVHLSVPAKTVPEFIAYAKANPGKLNMASAGIGGPQHIAGELFKFMAGVDLTGSAIDSISPESAPNTSALPLGNISTASAGKFEVSGGRSCIPSRASRSMLR